MFLSHNQNMVGFCNQITLLIINYISSRVEVIHPLISINQSIGMYRMQ